MARNHIRSGLRVSCNTVPAVSDTCRSQARQRSRLPRHFPRLAHCRAVGADKAIRPAKPPDIFPARRLAAKPRVELLERPRIINPSDGMPWRAFHPSTLSGVPTCVKGIPTYLDYQVSRFGPSGAMDKKRL